MRKELSNNTIDKNENNIKSKNTDDAIYFNFSYSALKLLGKNLYSNAANAISELVANALDAKAPEVYVYIDMSDKEHSIIEIIDNGIGMSYSDLAEKYVWIGRNKRADKELADDEKKTVMGRKGIGKLAALYLSNQYYIITKKENEPTANQWEINLSAYDDSDFPKLDRVYDSIKLVNESIWKSFKHGTVIKLNNVDLRRNGEQRIEGLRRVFADFYLLDALKSTIYVAVKTSKDADIKFEPVEKKIAYKNFYALFNNSKLNVGAKMNNEIAFTWASNYEHIANTPRKTILLNAKDFTTSGKRKFKKDDETEIEKEYNLSGWIAIHSTIEQKNAVDKNFIRNSVYQPNKLRLYVRNKLAVYDYFSISPSTQAMSNYIEGEITFNILDDDDLPDIATSSRQDFLDDERIELLTSIVDPILSTLFNARNKIGKKISDENREYTEYLIKIEEEKRRAEEEARVRAEEAKNRAEEEKKKAEQEKEEAQSRQKKAEAEAKKYRAQSTTMFNAVSEEQETFTAKTHLVKTNTISIRNSVTTLAKKIGIEKYRELSSIAISADKTLSALKYSALAKFNIEDEFIVENMFAFCLEYLNHVLASQYFDITISTQVKGEFKTRFSPQIISLILDNLMSNAEKSHSSQVFVNMFVENEKAIVTITDNGDGFGDANLNEIFEFGISNTGGTGIGLYNVKKAVEKMNGIVYAEHAEPKGASFIIVIN